METRVRQPGCWGCLGMPYDTGCRRLGLRMRGRRKRRPMGLFKEMYEQRVFNSDWEYKELRRKLSEGISRGYVEQVPVMKPHPWAPRREWYRDRETGEIYCLIGPDGKSRGAWDKVDAQDLVEPGERIQSSRHGEEPAAFPKQNLPDWKTTSTSATASQGGYNQLRETPSGECCHWVLDDVLQTVEWLSQPLGFESLALRQSLDDIKLLDNSARGVILEVFEGQRPVPSFLTVAPTDYRGFRVSWGR